MQNASATAGVPNLSIAIYQSIFKCLAVDRGWFYACIRVCRTTISTKDFPVQSELRKKKLEKLKSQQSIFARPNTRDKAAKIASYRVCHILGLFCFKALPD